MSGLAGLISSGGIALWILGLTGFELAGLLAWRRVSGRGLPAVELVPMILAGDFLLLAWWLSAANWALAGLALALAGGAHMFDLLRRLKCFT